jgi:ribosome assembly protein SQT1
MAPAHEHDPQEEGEPEEEFYIDEGDVLELDDDNDQVMDEDDDELGDLPAHADGEEGEEDNVVYEDNSVQHFPAHAGSVFCVAAHPTAPLAASGGEDDLGYLWDVESGTQLARLSGHSDSVTSIAFSTDGEMVATGGMDGKIRIWRRVGTTDWKKWEFLTELQGPDEVMVGDLIHGLYQSL